MPLPSGYLVGLEVNRYGSYDWNAYAQQCEAVDCGRNGVICAYLVVKEALQ